MSIERFWGFRSRVFFEPADHRSEKLFMRLEWKNNEAINLYDENRDCEFTSTYHIGKVVDFECICMQTHVSFKIVSIDFCNIIVEDRTAKQRVNLYHKTTDCNFSLSHRYCSSPALAYCLCWTRLNRFQMADFGCWYAVWATVSTVMRTKSRYMVTQLFFISMRWQEKSLHTFYRRAR